MRLSSVALLEGGDADALADGEEVTLKNWGNVKIKTVVRDAGGKSSTWLELWQVNLICRRCCCVYMKECATAVALFVNAFYSSRTHAN